MSRAPVRVRLVARRVGGVHPAVVTLLLALAAAVGWSAGGR